jgi:acetyl esterase
VPVDAALQPLLDQLAAAAGGRPEGDEPVDVVRAGYRALALLAGEPEPVVSIVDRTVPGPGGDIPVRVYRPAEGTLPVLVWFHSGGFVIGDLETADSAGRKLANRTGAVVVSVDYRLAPEHRWPAGFDDAWAVTSWLRTSPDELDVDASRIAVGGDSAGGSLATLVALRARDEGLPLVHQLLVYPVTDATQNQPSVDENGVGYILTKVRMQWFLRHALGPDADPLDGAVSPLHAPDLRGVAPATVFTAQYDPLRDEGDAYARRLAEAGVPVTHRCFEGMVHPFLLLGGVTPVADVAFDLAAGELRRAYGTSTSS